MTYAAHHRHVLAKRWFQRLNFSTAAPSSLKPALAFHFPKRHRRTLFVSLTEALKNVLRNTGRGGHLHPARSQILATLNGHVRLADSIPSPSRRVPGGHYRLSRTLAGRHVAGCTASWRNALRRQRNAVPLSFFSDTRRCIAGPLLRDLLCCNRCCCCFRRTTPRSTVGLGLDSSLQPRQQHRESTPQEGLVSYPSGKHPPDVGVHQMARVLRDSDPGKGVV